MWRYLSVSLVLASFTTGGTLRAATEPHAARAPETKHIWTNDDLKRLTRIPGLISIVGRGNDEAVENINTSPANSNTQDPAWYAAQAASLNARLESEERRLRDFTQALEDVREGKSRTAGINVFQDSVGITPDATIDILQNRISEIQGELDELEDLARRNRIDPGVLRGQQQDVSADTAEAVAEQSQSDSSAPRGDL